MKKSNKKEQTFEEFQEEASQLVTKLFQEYADENEVGIQLTFISFDDEADTQPLVTEVTLNNSKRHKRV